MSYSEVVNASTSFGGRIMDNLQIANLHIDNMSFLQIVDGPIANLKTKNITILALLLIHLPWSHCFGEFP